MGLIFSIIIILCIIWIYWLERDIYCPKCGNKLRKVGNHRCCDRCNSWYFVNILGIIKKWK